MSDLFVLEDGMSSIHAAMFSSRNILTINLSQKMPATRAQDH